MTILGSQQVIEVTAMRSQTFASFDPRSCCRDPKYLGRSGGGGRSSIDIEALKDWTVVIVAPGATRDHNPICVLETYASATDAFWRVVSLTEQLRSEGNRIMEMGEDTSSNGLKPYLLRDYIAMCKEAIRESKAPPQEARMEQPMPVLSSSAAHKAKAVKADKAEQRKRNPLLDDLELD